MANKIKKCDCIECLVCHKLSVFPKAEADGYRCLYCNGETKYVGEILVAREEKANAVVITMKADTTEIDAAIAKANELKEILKECGVIE